MELIYKFRNWSLYFAFTVYSIQCSKDVAFNNHDFTIQHSTDCSIDGHRLSPNQAVYLYGSAIDKNSIYAVCQKNRISCYSTNGEMDVDAIPIDCPNLTSMQNNNLKYHFKQFSLFESSETSRWPGGIVCYHVHHEIFKPKERDFIYKAMDHFEINTNIRFITIKQCKELYKDATYSSILTDFHSICGDCQNYVDITQDGTDKCYADVGMRGKRQILVMNSKCFWSHHYTSEVLPGAIAIHEFGHTIGLFHEHQHTKRSVKILWQNIPPNKLNNYVPMSEMMANTKYDKYSIMHYGEKYPQVPEEVSPRLLCEPLPKCTKSSESACIPSNIKLCRYGQDPISDSCTEMKEEYCKRLNTAIGAIKRLSEGDIESIQQMYPFKQEHDLPIDDSKNGRNSQKTHAPIQNRSKANQIRFEGSLGIILWWICVFIYFEDFNPQ